MTEPIEDNLCEFYLEFESPITHGSNFVACWMYFFALRLFVYLSTLDIEKSQAHLALCYKDKSIWESSTPIYFLDNDGT